jgi:hypothetical protein
MTNETEGMERPVFTILGMLDTEIWGNRDMHEVDCVRLRKLVGEVRRLVIEDNERLRSPIRPMAANPSEFRGEREQREGMAQACELAAECAEGIYPSTRKKLEEAASALRSLPVGPERELCAMVCRACGSRLYHEPPTPIQPTAAASEALEALEQILSHAAEDRFIHRVAPVIRRALRAPADEYARGWNDAVVAAAENAARVRAPARPVEPNVRCPGCDMPLAARWITNAEQPVDGGELLDELAQKAAWCLENGARGENADIFNGIIRLRSIRRSEPVADDGESLRDWAARHYAGPNKPAGDV